MGVSKNNGIPKSSIWIRVFPYFHHPFWVFPPLFLETPIRRSDHDSLGSSLHPCWTDIFRLGLNPLFETFCLWSFVSENIVKNNEIIHMKCPIGMKIMENIHMKFPIVFVLALWNCFACRHLTQYHTKSPCVMTCGERRLEMPTDGHGTSPSLSPVGRGTYQP